MSAEFNAKYIPPVPEYFSITCNRAAAFDLIVTLKWALAEGENLPESVNQILETIMDQYGDCDLPSGIAPLDIPDAFDAADVADDDADGGMAVGA